MIRFTLNCMVDTVVCLNCGLSYSTTENDLCSHCNFTNKDQ
jgi:NMD protein affecting ribosome stability and mRNA decay